MLPPDGSHCRAAGHEEASEGGFPALLPWVKAGGGSADTGGPAPSLQGTPAEFSRIDLILGIVNNQYVINDGNNMKYII